MAQSNSLEIISLQKWLLQLLGDANKLEHGVHDIKDLLALKTKNVESEKAAKEEIKMKRTCIYSINSKTETMKTLLKSEDVSLSDKSWKQIDKIAGLAAKMNIEELDLTNLLFAILRMKNQTIECKEQRMLNIAVMSSYSQQNLQIKKSNDSLKSQLDSVKEVVDTQDSKKGKIEENINFFNAKRTQYECNVKLNKDRLKNINFENTLKHSSLVEWSKVIEVLEERLKASLEKLKIFKNLPPNESLTKLIIQEKKAELKQLEDEFAALISVWENRDNELPFQNCSSDHN